MNEGMSVELAPDEGWSGGDFGIVPAPGFAGLNPYMDSSRFASDSSCWLRVQLHPYIRPFS